MKKGKCQIIWLIIIIKQHVNIAQATMWCLNRSAWRKWLIWRQHQSKEWVSSIKEEKHRRPDNRQKSWAPGRRANLAAAAMMMSRCQGGHTRRWRAVLNTEGMSSMITQRDSYINLGVISPRMGRRARWNEAMAALARLWTKITWIKWMPKWPAMWSSWTKSKKATWTTSNFQKCCMEASMATKISSKRTTSATNSSKEKPKRTMRKW